MPTLPVTVLSGFLGAGKTTLVNHLLKSDTDTRYAVLVNDLADINLREIKLKPGKTELQWNPRSGKLEGLVELHNGCICCTLREEFVSEVYDLAKLDKFDHLLIEASGVAEPIPIALAFDLEMPDGNPLQAHAPLDTLITVVDAHHFLKDWESAQKLRELGLNVDESDERTQAELLAEQVEFADIIIINKVDLVSEQELKRLRQLLNCINPGADIHTSMFGQVEHAKLISAPGPRPTRELTPLLASQRNLALHDQLEITTYVYRARRPFHPVRFWECINQEWPGIMRSKGLFWLATRMNDSGVWSQASSASNHQGGGRWWSAVPPEQWPTDPQATSAINLEFKGPFGDRRQEIVLIGSNLNRDEIKARLDACLLNNSELVIGSVGWRQLEDPFPAWESDDPDETEIMLTPFPKNVPSA